LTHHNRKLYSDNMGTKTRQANGDVSISQAAHELGINRTLLTGALIAFAVPMQQIGKSIVVNRRDLSHIRLLIKQGKIPTTKGRP